MAIPRPFADAGPLTRWLRATLLTATLLGMVSCLPLWLSTRAYPLVPVTSWFPVLPPVTEHVFLVATLSSLLAAAWFYRGAVMFFLVATFFLYCGDQNRGQPWMYLYWVLLVLTLWPEKTALAACRVALSVGYLWAGIQKLNGKFFEVMPAWFILPAGEWGLPQALLEVMKFSVATAPFLEIFIGLGLWFAHTRKPALVVMLALHLVSLLLLGPLGHQVNVIVWPWNLAMVALVIVLFGVGDGARWPGAWAELRRSGFALVVLGLFCLLPALSFFGRWDSYFSFALYSANLARADVYVNEDFRDALPPRLQRFVEPVKNFDPKFQLPFTFAHQKWAVAELGVPPLPEPRGFAVMFRELVRQAQGGGRCHMIVETRGATSLLFRPDQDQPLEMQR